METAASDGLSTLGTRAKPPGARSRKGANGRKPPGEGAQLRPPPLPDDAEPVPGRRRGRRVPVDAPAAPPPVNWRERTAATEAPPPSPPPVNWRELTASPAEPPDPLEPSRELTIVPQRETALVPQRKPGFFERLGFGRRRA
jgi:hypothetical protein